MNIDWQAFTVAGAISSFVGGLIIGIATIWLAFSNGKIAGISGIFGHLTDKLIHRSPEESGWQAAFIGGLIFSTFIWLIIAPTPKIQFTTNLTGLLLGGILVGFGTRLANGCTSGHGICGLSRLSVNSLIAVLTFMTSGFITVYISKYILGL